MITSPALPLHHGGQVLVHHEVHDTLLDLANVTLTVYIGSWPNDDHSGEPRHLMRLDFHYDIWQPEHIQNIKAGVSSHPDWSGAGPIKPSTLHRWNPVRFSWDAPPVAPLNDIKAAKWLEIKQARTQAEYAGFTWDGSTFDSDATSQNRIMGAVTLAQMSTAFTIGWTLKDNTVRTLDQAGMLQAGSALGAHVAVQFSRAQTLRVRIEAATTQAELVEIVWPTPP